MKNAILAIVSLAVLGCQAQYKTMLHARITPTNSVVVDIPDWAKSDNPPGGGGGGGTLDYNALTNKPSINGTTIEGSLTTEDLGITAGASDYNDLTNKPSINGVTLSENKTASDLGLATPDEALLAVYYPDGNVTSVDQITTEGLEYSYNDTTMTATLSNGRSATGDIVIPWKVVKDGKEYKVTAVGEEAFIDFAEGISANISSVTAPTTVTTIESFAFNDCRSLTSISFPSVTTTGTGCFGSCHSLKSISLPSITFIENETFNSCHSLTSISLPSVTRIYNSSFESCDSLTSISFPSAISISSYAFAFCHSLTSISLPSVTRIDEWAFESCHAIKSIDFGTIPRDTVPTLNSYAFYEVPTSCKIIVPLGMYDEWIAADGWKDLYAAGYQFVGYADAADVDKSIKEATADHVKSNDLQLAISPDNAAFSNAVLSVGIGVDTNAVSAINAILDGGDDALPVGGATTVGVLLAALAAALAALKKKVMEKYPFVASEVVDSTLTLTPFSRNALTSDGTAFTVAMGGDGTYLRDCVFVVVAGETAPTISWGVVGGAQKFSPRTDAATDMEIAANTTKVFWVTEYAPGEFAVAGWEVPSVSE